MGEPKHCGDPSCLICYPAITKTGHQITHDETGRSAAEAEQGIRAYSGPVEVSSRSSEQIRGVDGKLEEQRRLEEMAGDPDDGSWRRRRLGLMPIAHTAAAGRAADRAGPSSADQKTAPT